MFLLRREFGRSAQVEAVARYVDGLIAGSELPEGVEQSLAALIGALRRELRSQEPDPEFVATLRLRLIAAADQRGPVVLPIALWRQPRFIIGAASFVSAAAVLAFVARSRLPVRAA